MADEMLVSYSVKEVLERLERKIDDIHTNFDERLTVLETDKATREKRSDTRRWFIPMVTSTVVGLLAVMATVLVVIVP